MRVTFGFPDIRTRNSPLVGSYTRSRLLCTSLWLDPFRCESSGIAVERRSKGVRAHCSRDYLLIGPADWKIPPPLAPKQKIYIIGREIRNSRLVEMTRWLANISLLVNLADEWCLAMKMNLAILLWIVQAPNFILLIVLELERELESYFINNDVLLTDHYVEFKRRRIWRTIVKVKWLLRKCNCKFWSQRSFDRQRRWETMPLELLRVIRF